MQVTLDGRQVGDSIIKKCLITNLFKFQATLKKVSHEDDVLDEFSLILYYTTLLKETVGDVQMYADNLIAQLNQIFINTDIPLRARLHCLVESKVTEVKIDQFQSPADELIRVHGDCYSNILKILIKRLIFLLKKLGGIEETAKTADVIMLLTKHGHVLPKLQ